MISTRASNILMSQAPSSGDRMAGSLCTEISSEKLCFLSSFIKWDFQQKGEHSKGVSAKSLFPICFKGISVIWDEWQVRTSYTKERKKEECQELSLSMSPNERNEED